MAEITVETSGGMTSTFSTEDLNRIINILGKRDIRCFLPLFETDPADAPAAGDIQDYGPRGHHFVKDTTADNDPYIRGDVLAYRFNGTDEGIDMADDADFSFGADGTAPNEPAFSVGAAIKLTDGAGDTILSRYNSNTNQYEYHFYVAASDLNFRIYDAAAAVRIGRSYTTNLNNDQWYIVVGTYDASAANAGVSLYVDGAQVDDNDVGAGAYTAMHNTTADTVWGWITGGGGARSTIFDGDMALLFITGRELSATDVLRLTNVYRRVLGL